MMKTLAELEMENPNEFKNPERTAAEIAALEAMHRQRKSEEKPREFIAVDYTVAEHYLPYLINDDASGLDDRELESIDGWMINTIEAAYDVPEGYEFAHFSHDDNVDEFGVDEVSGLRGRVTTIQALFTKE
jgi:hypothetical protein